MKLVKSLHFVICFNWIDSLVILKMFYLNALALNPPLYLPAL